MTGRIADGAMLQLADPDLIGWFVAQVHDSARRPVATRGREDHGGRARARGRPADGRDRVRWFPALVGNHVVDLVNKYQGELPEALTHYIRGREGYDYLHHAEVGSSNADFVGDDSSTVSRRRRYEAHLAKLADSPRPASTSSTST